MNEFVQFQIKQGRNYITEMTVTEPVDIYNSLMHDLIAKKLHNASYIRSITDKPNYDGTRTITVAYDNACRRVYRVKF